MLTLHVFRVSQLETVHVWSTDRNYVVYINTISLRIYRHVTRILCVFVGIWENGKRDLPIPHMCYLVSLQLIMRNPPYELPIYGMIAGERSTFAWQSWQSRPTLYKYDQLSFGRILTLDLSGGRRLMRKHERSWDGLKEDERGRRGWIKEVKKSWKRLKGAERTSFGSFQLHKRGTLWQRM